MTRFSRIGLLALGVFACAAEGQQGPPPETEPRIAADTTAPAVAAPVNRISSATGFLTWEDLSVRMTGRDRQQGLRLDITSLNEGAVALAADDVRAMFDDVMQKALSVVTEGEIDDSTVFLVGYTGFEKEVEYDPTRLEIRSEGSTYYPRRVIPISPNFDRRILDLYETVYGVYLFESGIDLVATLEFQYGNLNSGGQWRSVVEKIQRARTQARSDEERE